MLRRVDLPSPSTPSRTRPPLRRQKALHIPAINRDKRQIQQPEGRLPMVEGHEGITFTLPSGPVTDHRGLLNRPEYRQGLSKRVIGCPPGNPPNEDFAVG